MAEGDGNDYTNRYIHMISCIGCTSVRSFGSAKYCLPDVSSESQKMPKLKMVMTVEPLTS